jgi:curli biogenesis system outer membrane secretion channel CsgG
MDKDNRGYVTVKMKVDVDKFKSVLGDQNKRVRLAVAEFEGLDRDTSVRLQDALKAYFVQARRFSVVDRSEGAQYAKEMAVVTSPAAALSERVRFGQVLGADFIVVGKVRLEKSQRKTLDPITMVESMRESVTAEVTFSAIEIATSQILWANTIKVLGGANLSASLDGISRMVGAQVSETLFPLRIVSADDPNVLTINQGGQSVALGQRFAVMQLGAELKDPDTKESLGRKETEVGLVEITRVDPNLSYAKLVSGKITKGTSMILRKPAALADAGGAGAAAAPNPGTRSKAFD